MKIIMSSGEVAVSLLNNIYNNLFQKCLLGVNA
jgi:hypothetical protein